MIRLFVLLLLLFFMSTLPAQATVKVIPLQHRHASELVEKLRGLLDADEKVEAAGSSLVLTASGESLTAAEQLIRLLDQPRHQYVVRLRYEEQDQTVGRKNTLSSGKKPAVNNSWGTGSPVTEQSLLVEDGTTGWLELSRKIPVTGQWSIFSGEVNGYLEEIDCLDISSGFLVSLQALSEGKVLLSLEPGIASTGRDIKGAAPKIDTTGLHSEISLPLNTWILLGSQTEPPQKPGQGAVSWGANGREPSRYLFVRIEAAAGFSP